MTSERVGGVLTLLLSLYMATVAVAAVYFNWEFARTNGFSRWLFLGEVVSTAKALVWPYFAFRTDGAAEHAYSAPSEIDRTRLSPQQISEMEVKKLILAINYSQQGAYLLNSSPHENLDDYPNLEDILAYRRKAVEVGKSADRGVLNSVYPGLAINSRMSLFRQCLCLSMAVRHIRTRNYIAAKSSMMNGPTGIRRTANPLKMPPMPLWGRTKNV